MAPTCAGSPSPSSGGTWCPEPAICHSLPACQRTPLERERGLSTWPPFSWGALATSPRRPANVLATMGPRTQGWTHTSLLPEWPTQPAKDCPPSAFPLLFSNHNSQSFWRRSTALVCPKTVEHGLGRCPTLNCSPFVLTPPLCWHQERGPGGLGSGVRALGLGLLWFLKDQEGGPKAPSFLYQLSSPAGDPQAVTSWQPQPYLHRQIRTGKSSF